MLPWWKVIAGIVGLFARDSKGGTLYRRTGTAKESQRFVGEFNLFNTDTSNITWSLFCKYTNHCHVTRGKIDVDCWLIPKWFSIFLCGGSFINRLHDICTSALHGSHPRTLRNIHRLPRRWSRNQFPNMHRNPLDAETEMDCGIKATQPCRTPCSVDPMKKGKPLKSISKTLN